MSPIEIKCLNFKALNHKFQRTQSVVHNNKQRPELVWYCSGWKWTKLHEPKFYYEMTTGDTSDLRKFLLGMPTLINCSSTGRTSPIKTTQKNGPAQVGLVGLVMPPLITLVNMPSGGESYRNTSAPHTLIMWCNVKAFTSLKHRIIVHHELVYKISQKGTSVTDKQNQRWLYIWYMCAWITMQWQMANVQ